VLTNLQSKNEFVYIHRQPRQIRRAQLRDPASIRVGLPLRTFTSTKKLCQVSTIFLLSTHPFYLYLNPQTCSDTHFATSQLYLPSKDPNMATPELIARVAEYVDNHMGQYDASHDFEHIKRVVGCAHLIHAEIVATQPEHPELDLNLITLSALLRKYSCQPYESHMLTRQ
jgi:hypothetical protein